MFYFSVNLCFCKLWNTPWFCRVFSEFSYIIDDYSCLKYYYSFTKLSQYVCLINTHNMINLHARCDCKLWNAIWFYFVFWIFSYIIVDYLCLSCCISTKFSQNVLDPNRPYMNTIQTVLGNVCLSVISDFCLSSVCCASTAYTSLFRGLKYLLKVRYIILNYPNVAWFFIFDILCLGRAKTKTYVWKNIHKMNGIFTECLSNQYAYFDILKCQM